MSLIQGRTAIVVGDNAQAQEISKSLNAKLLSTGEAFGHPELNDPYGDVYAVLTSGIGQEIKDLLSKGSSHSVSWFFTGPKEDLPPEVEYDNVARTEVPEGLSGLPCTAYRIAWDPHGRGFTVGDLVQWTQEYPNPRCKPEIKRMWLQRVDGKYRSAFNPNCHVGARVDKDELIRVQYYIDAEDLPHHLGTGWEYMIQGTLRAREDGIKERPTGFIAPNGAYFACNYHEHISLANTLFKTDTSVLVGSKHREGLGWIYVQSTSAFGGDTFWRTCDTLGGYTKAQAVTLNALGLGRDWDKPLEPYSYPEGFDSKSSLADRAISLAEERLQVPRETFFP